MANTRVVKTVLHKSSIPPSQIFVVKHLAENCGVPVSIDTSKAAVARACLEAGAQIVNDVTALTGDRFVALGLSLAKALLIITPVILVAAKMTQKSPESCWMSSERRRPSLRRAGTSRHDTKTVCVIWQAIGKTQNLFAS